MCVCVWVVDLLSTAEVTAIKNRNETRRDVTDDVIVSHVSLADSEAPPPQQRRCRRAGNCAGVVVVSGVRRMNVVNARRVRLLLGWVTVFGRVYHLGM